MYDPVYVRISAELPPFALRAVFTSVCTNPINKYRAAGVALLFQLGSPQGWNWVGRRVGREMTVWGLASARGRLLPGEETLCFRLNTCCDPHFTFFQCKSVGIQAVKSTFLKWVQNICLSWVINYISVQERKISHSFMINEWLFFFLGQICQQLFE